MGFRVAARLLLLSVLAAGPCGCDNPRAFRPGPGPDPRRPYAGFNGI